MADRLTIEQIAGAIADGTAIDWTGLESTASSEGERSVIRTLQRIEQLADHAREPSAASVAHGVNHEEDSPPGRWRWGPLSVVEKIGEGAFGEVYRAHDPRLARDVALKLLREQPSSSDNRASATIEEGRLLARVRHPNVVTIFGADRIDGRVGIWMELLQGTTLEQRLTAHGPFEAREAARLGIDLCRALAAVHATGVVHRDVKAQNVLRESDGRLVLMDFGTGREGSRWASVAVENLTGTPLYVAPEVLDGQPATIQSDLYGAGVLLYHLVTGSFPITARSLRELIALHRTNTRTSLRDSAPGLPAALIDVVDRATHTDPSSRFESARAMEQALVAVAEPRGAPRRRAKLVRVAAAVLAAAGIATVFWMGLRQRNGSTNLPPDVTVGRRAEPVITPSAEPAVESPNPEASRATPAPTPTSSPEHAPAPAPSSDKPWVLIAAFDNRTGESMLDGTIEYALQRELAGSPFVRPVSQDRVNDALALMQRPPGTRLDLATAREVCLRDGGIRAFIDGRVEKLGETYSLKADLWSPVDGSLIEGLPEQTATEDLLPAAIDREALAVRRALGEKLDLGAPNPTFPQVTTPSFRALQLYASATKFINGRKEDLPVALRYLNEAVAADPNFASAHWLLAYVLFVDQRPASEFMPVIARALNLADSATPVERDVIVGTYHYELAMAKDRDHPDQKEAQLAAGALTSALQADPTHALAASILHSVDNILAVPFDLARVLASGADTLPLNFSANQSAALERLRAGDLDGAHRYAAKAVRASREGAGAWDRAWIRFFPAYEAWARGDSRGASDALDAALDTSDDMPLQERRQLGCLGASMLLTLGRVRRAAEVAAAMPDDGTDSKLQAEATASVLWAQGAVDRLRELLRPHVAAPQNVRPAMRFWVPVGLAKEAQSLRPVSRLDRPLIDAQVAFAEGRFDDAVAAGEAFLAVPAIATADARQLVVLETMSKALVGRGDQTQAIALLERLLPKRATALGQPDAGPEWIQVRAELAALYRAAGRERDAHAIEIELLKLLAVADDDFPVLVELKRRVRQF